MRPLRRCIMCGATAFEQRKVPFTLTSWMRSQSSSPNMNTGPTLMTPALFTRMSTWPHLSMVVCTIAWHCAKSRTSTVDGDGLAAERLDAGDRLVAVGGDRRQVGEGDAHALLRQLVGDAAADAARAAGDDGDGVSSSSMCVLLRRRIVAHAASGGGSGAARRDLRAPRRVDARTRSGSNGYASEEGERGCAPFA